MFQRFTTTSTKLWPGRWCACCRAGPQPRPMQRQPRKSVSKLAYIASNSTNYCIRAFSTTRSTLWTPNLDNYNSINQISSVDANHRLALKHRREIVHRTVLNDDRGELYPMQSVYHHHLPHTANRRNAAQSSTAQCRLMTLEGVLC